MGCSASRLDTYIAKAIEDPSPSSTSTSSFSSKNSSLLIYTSSSSSSVSPSCSSMVPKTRSLSTPLVHHPATKKGDTHHLVCLTSTTYGSLVDVDNNRNYNHNHNNSKKNDDDDNQCSSVEKDDEFSEKASPDSVINAWELMEGLEDDEVDSGNDFMSKSVNLCDSKDSNRFSGSKLGVNLVDSDSDSKVKSSNLCDFNDSHEFSGSKIGVNLVGSRGDYKVKSSNLCDFNDSHEFLGSKIGVNLVGSGGDYKVKSSNLCDFKDSQEKIGVNLVGSGVDYKVKSTNVCDFKDFHEFSGSKIGVNLVGSKVKSSNLCDFKDSHEFPSSEIGKHLVGSGGDYKVKSSNLCDFKETHEFPSSEIGMNLADYKVKSSNLCDFEDAQKLPCSRLGLDLIDCSSDFKVMYDEEKLPSSRLDSHFNDSYVFVDIPSEIVEEEANDPSLSTKPLWEHLSHESLLSKTDPYIGNAYETAFSPEIYGFAQSRNESPNWGSSPVIWKSNSIYSNSPMGSKLSNDDKIVLYFTTLRSIRKTYEDCSTVRAILRGFRVVVDERDISMDSSFRQELRSKLMGKAMSLPQLFIRGKHIGGADDVKLLHETGELESILEGCPTKDCESVCECCGDARFVPCSNCYGSRKVYEEEEGRTRKCPECNENGLLRCPACCS